MCRLLLSDCVNGYVSTLIVYGLLLAEVKISRNAVTGPRNLGLEHSGCKIIWLHSRNVCSWTQQVSNIRYSNHIISHSNFTLLNVFTKFYKIAKKKQYENYAYTFSRSLIIWEPAVETWAQQMNGGPGNELGAERAERFPHLGNYTLTPGCWPHSQIVDLTRLHLCRFASLFWKRFCRDRGMRN